MIESPANLLIGPNGAQGAQTGREALFRAMGEALPLAVRVICETALHETV